MIRNTKRIYAARFDSSWGMVKALARFLKGEDNPGVGILPSISLTKPAELFINSLGEQAVTTVYAYEGATEALPANLLSHVNTEKISFPTVNQYPRRKYPAVMVGSPNGAVIHLCAALGIPWLPQTFLIALRHPKLEVDQPTQYMEWAKGPARAFIRANPDIHVHQMHDPAQDRLMSQHMAYFRVKRLRLGKVFREYIEEVLEPGGTIFVVECNLAWPIRRVSGNHFFQTGGLGGVTPEEYINGSEKVARFLKEEGSRYTDWEAPEPDGRGPEAEWGFEPEMLDDITGFARTNNYKLRRISFYNPEDMSPPVAELYRWWYGKRDIPSNRLLVECFNIMDPWWTLRTGSCPFWLVFNMGPSADCLEKYLSECTPYDYIHLMLLSHGVTGPGIVPIEKWRKILHNAEKEGSFLGVNEDKYPKDMAVFLRYNRELKKIPSRYPMPEPLPLSEMDNYLNNSPYVDSSKLPDINIKPIL